MPIKALNTSVLFLKSLIRPLYELCLIQYVINELVLILDCRDQSQAKCSWRAKQTMIAIPLLPTQLNSIVSEVIAVALIVCT